jgi:hypothetical protein
VAAFRTARRACKRVAASETRAASSSESCSCRTKQPNRTPQQGGDEHGVRCEPEGQGSDREERPLAMRRSRECAGEAPSGMSSVHQIPTAERGEGPSRRAFDCVCERRICKWLVQVVRDGHLPAKSLQAPLARGRWRRRDATRETSVQNTFPPRNGNHPKSTRVRGFDGDPRGDRRHGHAYGRGGCRIPRGAEDGGPERHGRSTWAQERLDPARAERSSNSSPRF